MKIKKQTIKKKSPWLKKSLLTSNCYGVMNRTLTQHKLHTICQEGKCPNQHECWSDGHATFLILGDSCTRNCSFCSVSLLKSEQYGMINDDEIENVAKAVQKLELTYCVLTSVTRDDLGDGGASFFHDVVQEILIKSSKTLVEVLIPDFQTKKQSLDLILNSKAHVIGHNIETVKRIHELKRGKNRYQDSLSVLKYLSDKRVDQMIKSAFMLGMGETEEEVINLLNDLRDSGVDCVYMGQYLRPTIKQDPVQDYITPEQFNHYGQLAKDIGFSVVLAGPFVRSSYKALESYRQFCT